MRPEQQSPPVPDREPRPDRDQGTLDAQLVRHDAISKLRLELRAAISEARRSNSASRDLHKESYRRVNPPTETAAFPEEIQSAAASDFVGSDIAPALSQKPNFSVAADTPLDGPFDPQAFDNQSSDTFLRAAAKPTPEELRKRIEKSGIFDAAAYMDMHEDLKTGQVDAWDHFIRYGLTEGRQFTTSEAIARALSRIDPKLRRSLDRIERVCAGNVSEYAIVAAAAPLVSRRTKIGIFCNAHGNFFMHEIANLLAWQLQALRIDASVRTEESDLDESFDIRIFVAPHEFFWLGHGPKWRAIVSAPNSVLFNVEQLQTQWFCRAFPFLLDAPLVMDINFQSALLLQEVGCRTVHYMPPYLSKCSYTAPQPDVSNIEIIRAYEFSRREFNWTKSRDLQQRPIDLLFIGSGSERRLKAIERIRDLTDKYRFICVYTHQNSPLNQENYRTTSPEINCALSQRAKIVLNIHRDWLGYFEWSRMVMQGFWQGACVVSDPSLPDPVFKSGEHFLEENIRHLPDLLHWLLAAPEGRKKMNQVATAGHKQATSRGGRAAMLVPMLNSLGRLIGA